MEKRALIAFVLSMAVFVGWMYLFPSPAKQPAEQTTTTEQAVTDGAGRTAAPDSGAATLQTTTNQPTGYVNGPAEYRDVTVNNDLFTAVFTEKGGRLKSLTLKKYRSTAEQDSPPKELVTVDSPANWPLKLYFMSGKGPDLADGLFQADQTEINVDRAGRPAELTMTFQDPAGLQVVRTYTFQPDSYLIGLKVTLRNLSSLTVDDNLVLEMDSGPFAKGGRRYSFAGLGALVDDKLHEIKIKKIQDDIKDVTSGSYELQWAAYEDQYFFAGILPADQAKTRLQAEPLDLEGVQIRFVNPPLVMSPQTEKSYDYQIYYGPKDYKILKSMDNGLGRSVYFGWFDILSKPLLLFMLWLHGFVKNYGVVIIIITVLIKAIFWPLTAKSYKSMKGMQKLQPKIMKLREKYKGDREGMNREMMQLYRTYKVNPLGGCLPMVIQIPVFIALYRLLDYSLELRHAPFWLWINDLAAPDRLGHFAVKLPLLEEPTGIPVLTLFMGATMFLQQKMTPTPGDPTQAKVMMFMPIFFTFIFLNFPAGLVLYWLVNNILSIGQQYFINKRPG